MVEQKEANECFKRIMEAATKKQIGELLYEYNQVALYLEQKVK